MDFVSTSSYMAAAHASVADEKRQHLQHEAYEL